MDHSWHPSPEWTPYEKSDTYTYTMKDGVATFTTEGGGGTMIWSRNPQPRLDVSKMRFVSLRYRLANTNPKLLSYLLYLDDSETGGMTGKNLIFGAEDLMHDGQWHTATTTLNPFGEIGTMAFRIQALEGQQGKLEVGYLRFSATPPRNTLKEVVNWSEGESGLQGQYVPLDAKTSVADTKAVLDLSEWFTSPTVTVNGINFAVKTEGPTAISTPLEPREPVTVPVGKQGNALYLLMGGKFPYKMLDYGGWAVGDMTDRAEQFTIRLNYADGTTEQQIPYCLAYERHGVWRGLNVYALPLEAKPLRDVELNDGMRTSSLHLVALTVADRSLAPAQSETPVRFAPAKELTRTPAMTLREGLLTIPTRTGEFQFDLKTTPRLTAITNACQPQSALRLQEMPLFSLREGKQSWTAADFRVTDCKLTRSGADLTLTSEAAQFEARLRLEQRDRELALNLQLRSLGAAPRTVEVRFPQVGFSAPAAGDMWYFMPTACATWSNADRAYRYPHSGDLPAQFVDLYDGVRGDGIYLATRSLDLRQRYFQLNKARGQTRLNVEYGFNPPFAPGQWVSYPETVLGLHAADWKPAVKAYQDWYRPAVSQAVTSRRRPAWYSNVWNFRTWWTHTQGDGRPDWNFLDRSKMEYQVDKFLERDREQFGQVDMFHLFDWRWTKKYGLWGDYSHYEEELGGLDKFRGAIKALQDKGVRVGLYLDTYLCSRKSDIGKAHGLEWAIHRADGRLPSAYSTPDDPMFNMCVNHPGWQDYLAETCARVAKETGCDGIYLDEGMSDYQAYWCWNKYHGHPVPGVNQPGLHELCKKVRAALPDNVAFYAEWAPADSTIPYLDGAYQAHLAHYDIRVTPGYLQTARFLYPNLRIFTVSNGGSMYDGIWEGLKYNIFSGVPLYSLAWGHDPEVLPLFRKMSQILHDHGEAFNTPTPRPFIQTERPDVYCSEFPGAKETVWTLYNGRYRTVRGPLLKVKHVAGAKYTDVWNGKPLQPKIAGGMAIIATEIGPRGIGLVTQTR